jgi:hypothetical protein
MTAITETTCPVCGLTTLLVVGPDQFGCETCGYATDNFERLVMDAMTTAAMDSHMKLTPEMHLRLRRLLDSVRDANKNASRSEVLPPLDWNKRKREWVVLGAALRLDRTLDNKQLAQWMDQYSSVPCPHGDTWEQGLRDGEAVYKIINRVRTWLKIPGRVPPKETVH